MIISRHAEVYPFTYTSLEVHACQSICYIFQCTQKCNYLLKMVISFLLNIYPKVGLLEHMVVLVLWGILILFSIIAVSIYNATNNMHSFSFLYIVTPFNFWILAILAYVKWFLLVALICISLMINDFIDLLAISTSSLWKCLLGSLVYF